MAEYTVNDVRVYRDSAGVYREYPITATGSGASGGSMTVTSSPELDTSGGAVPTYKAHTYTYDSSGNVATDTVTDGTSTWIKSFMYSNGNLTTDSGWVKQ